ncbi:thialysine N-epsilon-acetyltransferase-like isoform X3 [Choristoneura fumiferana]|uniref:thialysine N-epsilon-acetyltransferase-like isoform X3 n=1 Tax=Choristoneura fumiferana TaxID=7141 RepID=UPI003D15394A
MSATDSITVRLGRPEDMSVVFEMIKKTADNNGVHGHEHLTIQTRWWRSKAERRWARRCTDAATGPGAGAPSYWSACTCVRQRGGKGSADAWYLSCVATPGTDCVSSERRDRSDVVHNQSPDANQNMVTARLALLDDMAAISDMINELAVYQEHPDGPQLSVKDLEEDGFGSSPWFFAFVAERDGVAVGMVMGNRDWDGTRGHYLQSLYVRPSARRCGVAVLLIKEFCKFSLAQGVEYIHLNVANDNAPALKLYRRLRAVDVAAVDCPVAYRISRSQIKDIVLQSQF